MRSADGGSFSFRFKINPPTKERACPKIHCFNLTAAVPDHRLQPAPARADVLVNCKAAAGYRAVWRSSPNQLNKSRDNRQGKRFKAQQQRDRFYAPSYRAPQQAISGCAASETMTHTSISSSPAARSCQPQALPSACVQGWKTIAGRALQMLLGQRCLQEQFSRLPKRLCPQSVSV